MNSLMPVNTTRPRLIAPTAAISFLSQEDTLKLNELERKVQNSFLETCRALCEIKNYKDGLFWKGRFNSFAEYVKERFNYQAQHAYRLAAAGEFVQRIEVHNSSSTTKIPLPEKEIQVRHIINKIPEDKRLQCWQGIATKTAPSELSGVVIEAEVVEFRKKLPRNELRAHTRQRKPKPGIAEVKNASLRLVEKLNRAVQSLPNSEQLLKGLKRITKLIG